MLIVVILIAIWLDHTLGEPKSYHPLVGFGKIAHRLEAVMNGGRHRFVNGILAAILAIAPAVWVLTMLLNKLSQVWYLSLIIEALVLYWAIGHRSLKEHVILVKTALDNSNVMQARNQLAKIVSRDTNGLDHTQITQATIETTLENGSDGVFAPIFWFCVLGAPAVVAYRLINTLDAMWGYRNERYEWFGKGVALADDAMNYLPARLVALSYALLGNAQLGFQCWKRQAHQLSSPNAGPVMAAGAGSLNVKLGGAASYHGVHQNKPYFGGTHLPNSNDIERAIELIDGTLIVWVMVLLTFYCHYQLT